MPREQCWRSPGKTDAAVHMIRMAIEQNYCAYSALENDPLLAKLRATSEFAELLRSARFCQQPLLAASGASTNRRDKLSSANGSAANGWDWSSLNIFVHLGQNLRPISARPIY